MSSLFGDKFCKTDNLFSHLVKSYEEARAWALEFFLSPGAVSFFWNCLNWKESLRKHREEGCLCFKRGCFELETWTNPSETKRLSYLPFLVWTWNAPHNAAVKRTIEKGNTLRGWRGISLILHFIELVCRRHLHDTFGSVEWLILQYFCTSSTPIWRCPWDVDLNFIE